MNKETLAGKSINIFGKILLENGEECTIWLQAFSHPPSPVFHHFGSLKQKLSLPLKVDQN